MDSNVLPKPKSKEVGEKKRERYQPPSIVYEGIISVRAGSVGQSPAGPVDGPTFPFDSPDNN